MEWLQKVIAQLNRVFPNANVSENATEAEVVDFLEGQESISEVLENSEKLTGIISRLEKLESASPTEVDTSQFVTVESLKQSFVEFGKEQGKILTKIKTDLASEINTLKTTSSGTQTTIEPNLDPPKKQKSSKDDENSMKIDMSELFKSEVVPGLQGIL
jgi:hypothetical protein